MNRSHKPLSESTSRTIQGGTVKKRVQDLRPERLYTGYWLSEKKPFTAEGCQSISRSYKYTTCRCHHA